jgi:hypothetical protein
MMKPVRGNETRIGKGIGIIHYCTHLHAFFLEGRGYELVDDSLDSMEGGVSPNPFKRRKFLFPIILVSSWLQ